MDLNKIRSNLEEISVDLNEIKLDLNEISLDLNRFDKIRLANYFNQRRKLFLMCFLVELVENRFSML